MWPFGKKKEEDDLAAFERELGLQSTDTEIKEEPRQESYDNLPEEPTNDLDSSPRRQLDMSRSSSQSFQTQVQPLQINDLQLISAKLDTIKAMLEMLNQRIANLEKNAEEKPKQKLW